VEVQKKKERRTKGGKCKGEANRKGGGRVKELRLGAVRALDAGNSGKKGDQRTVCGTADSLEGSENKRPENRSGWGFLLKNGTGDAQGGRTWASKEGRANREEEGRRNITACRRFSGRRKSSSDKGEASRSKTLEARSQKRKWSLETKGKPFEISESTQEATGGREREKSLRPRANHKGEVAKGGD